MYQIFGTQAQTSCKALLKKISLAMSMDKAGLCMVDVGRFKHASKTISGSKEYDI